MSNTINSFDHNIRLVLTDKQGNPIEISRLLTEEERRKIALQRHLDSLGAGPADFVEERDPANNGEALK